VEVLAFAKQRKPFQVQFGLKKHVKNTGIYRYSDCGISVFGICDIDPLYLQDPSTIGHSPVLYNLESHSMHTGGRFYRIMSEYEID
jgi:hypothetical protein